MKYDEQNTIHIHKDLNFIVKAYQSEHGFDGFDQYRDILDKFNIITENTRDVFWIIDSKTLKFTFITPSVRYLTGYTVEEAMNQSLFETISPSYYSSITETINERIISFFAGDETQKTKFDEIEQLCKDGSYKWVEISTSFILDSSHKLVALFGVSRDITKRKELEKKIARENEYKTTLNRIKESNKRFQNITNEITDYMYSVKVENGKTIQTIHTDQCYIITGYTKEEISIDTYLWINMVHENDRDTVKQMAENAQKGIKTEPLEHRNYHKNGSLKWILNTIVIRYDLNGLMSGYDGLIKDITQNKEFEEKLIYTALVLENISDAVISTDCQHTIKSWNKAAEKIYGWKAVEIIGTEIFKLFSDSHGFKKNLFPDIELSISKDNIWKGDVRQITLSGNTINVLMTVSNVIHNDKVIGFMYVCNDITEKKLNDEKNKLMEENLIQIDKMSSIGLLASGSAHEINNPNQYIMTNIEILSEIWGNVRPILEEYYVNNGDFYIAGLSYNEVKESIEGMYGNILKSSYNIKHIIDELKLYIRNDQFACNEYSDLNMIVLSSIELLSSIVKSYTEIIDLRLSDSKLLINCNFKRIEQVLINLIQNAYQALSDESGTICISTGYNENGSIFVRIQDNGCGMDESALKKLTIPFNTTKKNTGGSGLGIYVSRNIIQTYKGTLEYKSVLGEGTTVTVSFPLHCEEVNRGSKE